jgi:hypothetical protein
VLASQIFPLGSPHIRFHDALVGGHEGRHLSEEVHHETNALQSGNTSSLFSRWKELGDEFFRGFGGDRQSKRFHAGQENKDLLDWLRSFVNPPKDMRACQP